MRSITCSICSGVALSDMFTIMVVILSGSGCKTSSCAALQKQKPRSSIAASVESLELCLLPGRLAPDLHTRREHKPIAANKVGGAKSFHKLCAIPYCDRVLATLENALLALPPIRRTVPM